MSLIFRDAPFFVDASMENDQLEKPGGLAVHTMALFAAISWPCQGCGYLEDTPRIDQATSLTPKSLMPQPGPQAAALNYYNNAKSFAQSMLGTPAQRYLVPTEASGTTNTTSNA